MKKCIRSISNWRRSPVLSKSPKLGAASLMLLAYPLMWAQDSGEEEEGDIFELSPFVVDASEDEGWRSTNSTSGTSLNTPIKDIPMSIEVINSDFLDDIQADTFDEALEYSAGVNLVEHNILSGTSGPNEAGSSEQSASAQGGIGQRFTNGTNIRGFNVSFQNRLGFRYGGSIASFGVNMGGLIDNVNTERMEVVRGPNSLLYGIGVLSGIVNVMPKTPLSEAAGSVSLAVGSDDYYRRTFDWTAPIVKDWHGGDLSYRIATALTRSGSEKEVYEENKEYYVGQLQYQSDDWNVFLELQHAKVKQTGIGASDFLTTFDVNTEFRNEYYEPYSWNRYYSRDGDYWLDKDVGSLSESDQSIYDSVGDYDPYFSVVSSDAYATLEETDITFDVAYTPNDNFSVSAGAFITDLEERTFDVSGETHTNSEFINRVQEYVEEGSATWQLEQAALAKAPEDRTDADLVAIADMAGARQFYDDYITVFETPQSLANPDGVTDYKDYRSLLYTWSMDPKDTSTEQYRLRLQYRFETPDFFKDSTAGHTITSGVSYIHDVAQFTSNIGPGDASSDAGSDVNAGTSTYDDYTFNHGTGGLVFPGDITSVGVRNVSDFSPLQYNGEEIALSGAREYLVDVWYRSAYALYSGDFWNDKINVLAGWRYDEYFTRSQLFDRFDENAPFYEYDSYIDFLASDDILDANGVKTGDSNGLADSFVEAGGVVQEPRASSLQNAGLVWAYSDEARANYTFRPYPIDEYGPDEDYSSESGLTFAMNYDITEGLTLYGVTSGGVTPNIGLLDGNQEPIPSEKSTNREIGLKFELFDRKLSGTISFYEIERENAVWYLDSAPNPSSYGGHVLQDPTVEPGFDAEKVQSGEYDITYSVHYQVFQDVVEAGLLSLFENGGDGGDFTSANANYDPRLFDSSTNMESEFGFVVNTLSNYILDDAGNIIGRDTNPQFSGGVFDRIDEYVFTEYENLDEPLVAVTDSGYTHIYFGGGEYSHEIIDAPGANPDVNIYNLPVKYTVRDVMEQAFADTIRDDGDKTAEFRTNEEYNPLRRDFNAGAGYDENASFWSSGANVTFTDIATGYDVQLIYQPTKSWQFTFNYAHTEREAQGAFGMVDSAVDLNLDGVIDETEQFATEYDLFVRIMGREAYGLVEEYYTDDAGNVLLDTNGNARVKQVTLNGEPVGVGDILPSQATGGIDGVSLFYGYEDSASLVQKYTFREGVFKGFSAALGLVYQGPANTSIAIGGTELASNLYQTPETPDRLYANLNLNYSWTWGNFPMKAALRVSNVFDDTYDVNYVEYENVLDGTTETRRSEQYYAPRSYRFSLSTSF